MQSSPPHSSNKAHTLRELSRSLSHSPRSIPSPSPPPSDSNPTRRSGFGTETSNFFDDPDVLMSTQHRIEDDTNTLPRLPRIRSTAKKVNTFHMFRSEQPLPDTSLVKKEFGDFDHGYSDDDMESVEQARGGNRSNRGTPSKMSSQFNSLYDITPPTNRSRKSYAAETGSLRRDAQIRRASRNDMDAASPRPTSKRNSPAVPEHHGRKATTLAQLHAKLSADESSFMDHRPPTLTVDSTKNTRWGNRSRHTSLQLDGAADATSGITARSKAANTTAQSFILPDLPNLTELVSGVFEDGTPVFSKTAPSRAHYAAPPNGGRRQPEHIPLDGVPIPQEEKAIFAALQQLQDKVAQMEQERAESIKTIEEQDMELIELRATVHAQEKLQRGDTSGSHGEKSTWRVEKTSKYHACDIKFLANVSTELDASVQTLRTKFDRAERKIAVLEIEKKRLNHEKDDMAAQLSVAFQTCEELKIEKSAFSDENDALREEIDVLRAEIESLRQKLDQEYTQHRDETVQLRQHFDQTANATQKKNVALHADLARVRAQHDDHTQQLARQSAELQKARQEQADFDRLKNEHASLKAQLAEVRTKREQEAKRWSRQESMLRAQVDHRDETIRNFQNKSQGETNEAMRLDNESLRQELAQLVEQHERDNDQWARKEADMRRKIKQRESIGGRSIETTRDAFDCGNERLEQSIPAGANTGKSAVISSHRNSSLRREDTRTRIKNRVEQELHDVRIADRSEAATRKTYTDLGRSSKRTLLAPEFQPHRSCSAPNVDSKKARVESEVDSTTDLSLAHRSVVQPTPKPTTIKPPVDLDLTELSYIGGAQIAHLRRTLEQERAALRRRSSVMEDAAEERNETVHSQQLGQEFTGRSVMSTRFQRQSDLPRKSSMKDNTQRTNVTHCDEDVTGNLSNLDADGEATQTKQSVVDLSMLSNTSRRRRSAPTEMTSAFILPDIKLEGYTTTNLTTAATTNLFRKSTHKDHDNNNCMVCRREGLATSADEDVRVPKLVAVSLRMPDDVEATLRPARSPRDALALVVKELQDERAHLHMELAVMRTMLEAHDASLGNHKRREINASIQDILRKLEIKDMQIYNLYDVLEGQKENELTELDVENITEQLRAEEADTKQKKAKKVTIRSFVDNDSVEIGRGQEGTLDELTEELPWEGFEEGVEAM